MAYRYYKDNREFIKALGKTGDLVTIEQEVDWDLEMGAIVRRVYELKAPSCLLYTSPSPRDQRGSRMPSSA